MSAMFEAALDYRERGWSILPIAPGSKRPNTPLLPLGRDGKRSWKPYMERAASVSEVSEWFERDPATGIGIICGEASHNLVVIDFDGVRPAMNSVPDTPVVATPGNGAHVYAKSKGRVRTRRFTQGEIRGESSYVVAPPSVHPSGRSYGWLIPPDARGLASLDRIPRSLIGLDPKQLTCEYQSTHPSEVPRYDYEIPRCSLQLEEQLTGERGLRAGLDVAALAKSERAVARVATTLGIPLHGAFLCILPGHEERSPSASLHQDPETGLFLCRDWHERDGHAWYTLAELRASLSYRRAVKLGASEQARWYTRLFYEAGLIETVSVEVPTNGLDAIEKKLAVGFALLLGLNWIREPDEPAPFTRRFAAAWCGVSEREAAGALQALRRRDVIRVVDEHPRTGGGTFPLYLPGTGRVKARGAA